MKWQVFILLIWCMSVVRSQYEPYGENVASGKPANQSTTYGAYSASLGVDGKISTNVSEGTCSHTGEGLTYSWWTVDLLGFYFIKFIRIYQWTGTNVNRLDGSTMYVKLKDNTWKQIYFNSTWPSRVFSVSVELDKPIGEIMLNNSKVQGAAAFICVCELQAFKVIECLPYSIENGRIEVVQYGDSNQTFTYGTQLNVTCHEGYRMSYDEVESNEIEIATKCNSTGYWTRNLTCAVIDCGQPVNIPDNSTIMSSTGLAGNTSYNATMKVVCDQGFNYTLPGNDTIRCTDGGQWIGILGHCKVIECLPYSIENGRIEVVQYGESNQTFTYGTQLNVICHEGYRMSYDEVVSNETEITTKCNANGYWTRNLTCSVTDCGWPPNIPSNSKKTLTHGIAGNTTYNATLTVQCNEGYNYSLQDIEPLRCARNGIWAGNLGNCTVIDCGQPKNIPDNSTVKTSNGLAGNTSYNATLTVACDKGFNYTLPGNETIRCGVNGSWMSSLGLCKVTGCTGIVPPEYGVIVVEMGIEGRWSFNTTVAVVCNTGYSLSGEALIKCLGTGRWTSALGYCLALQQTISDEEQNKTSLLAWIIFGPLCLILLVTNIVTCFRLRRHESFKREKRNNIPDDVTIAHKVHASDHGLQAKEGFSAYDFVEDSDMETIKNKSNGSDNIAMEPYDNLQTDKRAKSEYEKLKFERESSLKTTMKN